MHRLDTIIFQASIVTFPDNNKQHVRLLVRSVTWPDQRVDQRLIISPKKGIIKKKGIRRRRSAERFACMSWAVQTT